MANVVVQYLRDVASAESDVADAELLHRYVANRDEIAFGLLVRRHGPMVLGVCRRVLGPTGDADDAFQATFLALARKPQQVSECLAGWLHRVAFRAAHRSLRREKISSLNADTADRSDPFADVEWRDLRAILDAELERLPEQLRMPLILCYLDGLTRDDAAKRLGWSLRTVHRRLDEARTRLHARLIQRGISPMILAATVFTAHGLRSAVPKVLLRMTMKNSVTDRSVPLRVQELMPSLAVRGVAMKAIAAVLVMTALGGVAVAKTSAHRTAKPAAEVTTPDTDHLQQGDQTTPDTGAENGNE